MTSTRSADATGLPDRRRILSTLTGAGALGLPALPALAYAPGPIEAMFAEHLRLEAIASAAAVRMMDIEERYEEPDRPRWHMLSAGGYEIVRTAPGRGITYLDLSDENIAVVRAQAAAVYDPEENYLGYKAAERARSTLAEIEAWQAEVKHRKDALGLTQAEAEGREAYAAADAHRTAMLAIEAGTIRELAHQAALFDDDWRQLEGERLIVRLAELVGVVPHSQREGAC